MHFSGDTKRPLIVWVHGGPHSILLNKYNPIGSIFVRLGYSIVIPNYRGSLGQGKVCLESLPGNCGKMDVDDVFQAVIKCLERFVIESNYNDLAFPKFFKNTNIYRNC